MLIWDSVGLMLRGIWPKTLDKDCGPANGFVSAGRTKIRTRPTAIMHLNGSANVHLLASMRSNHLMKRSALPRRRRGSSPRGPGGRIDPVQATKGASASHHPG